MKKTLTLALLLSLVAQANESALGTITTTSGTVNNRTTAVPFSIDNGTLLSVECDAPARIGINVTGTCTKATCPTLAPRPYRLYPTSCSYPLSTAYNGYRGCVVAVQAFDGGAAECNVHKRYGNEARMRTSDDGDLYLVTGGSGGSLAPAGQEFATITTAPISLVVDAQLGSDANACTDGGIGACATCNGALAKVPRLIRDPVDILLSRYDGGTLTCAVSGFSFIQGMDGGSASLHIHGEAGLAAGLTGSVSGTAAGGSNTAGQLGVQCQVQAAAADLTVNQLKGYHLQITSGPGAGTMLPIVQNDAQNINLATACSATPTSSSVYRVVDFTLVSGATQMPRSLDAGTVTSSSAALWTANAVAFPRSIAPFLKFSQLTVAPSTGYAFLPVGGGRIDLHTMQLKASQGATGTAVALGPASDVVLTNVSLGSTAASTGTAISGVAGSAAATSLSFGGSYIYTRASTTGTGIASPGTLLVTSSFNVIDNRGAATTWSGITSGGVPSYIGGTWLMFFCGGGASTSGFSTTAASAPQTISINHVWFDQCAKGFSLRSPLSMADVASASSADAGVLMDVSRAAKLIYANALPSTGYARLLSLDDAGYDAPANLPATGEVLSLSTGAYFGTTE